MSIEPSQRTGRGIPKLLDSGVILRNSQECECAARAVGEDASVVLLPLSQTSIKQTLIPENIVECVVRVDGEEVGDERVVLKMFSYVWEIYCRLDPQFRQFLGVSDAGK